MLSAAHQAMPQRAPQLPEALEPSTIQWLASLPPHLRPRQLPIQFVRIANRLSNVWQDQAACRAYFQELLIDRRGGRRGFPGDVGSELAALQNHYEADVYAAPQTVWDLIAGRRRD